MIPLAMLINWLDEIDARGGLDALTDEDRKIAQDLMEHLSNFNRLRTHHVIVEAEVMELRLENRLYRAALEVAEEALREISKG